MIAATITPTRLTFWVAGNPVAQGSMRAFIPKGGKRPVVIHDRAPELRSWRESVRWAAREAMARQDIGLLSGPIAIFCRFHLLSPRSRPATLRTARQQTMWLHPWRRPDLDKLGRGLLDSLVGVLIADDAQVVRLDISKHYATEPGASIEVEELAQGV